MKSVFIRESGSGQRRREKIENIRVGYQGSIHLLANEKQTSWTRYTAMLIANSILVAAIATLAKGDNGEVSDFARHASIILAFAGIVVCFCWLSILKRARQYHRHWIACARDFEGNLEGVKTLINGRRLSHGEKVGKQKMKGLAKLRMGYVSPSIIYVFIILYMAYLLHVGEVRYLFISRIIKELNMLGWLMTGFGLLMAAVVFLTMIWILLYEIKKIFRVWKGVKIAYIRRKIEKDDAAEAPEKEEE